MEFTNKELNLFRQWYNAMEDNCPEYLTKEDWLLARKVYEAMGLKLPRNMEKLR